MGVRRTFRLGKHVGDAYTLKNSTHGTASLHSRTMGSRTEQHTRAAELGSLLVGDSPFMHGNLDQVLFCSLNPLCNGGGNLISLSETPANNAVLVTYNDNRGKCEGAATLCHFCDTVDGDQAVFQLDIVCGFYSIILIYHDCFRI